MRPCNKYISDFGTASPTILFLEPQPCVRALKYAKGLKWAFKGKIRIVLGYQFFTLNKLYGHGDEVFDKLVKLDEKNPEKGIKRLVDKFRPMLIHSHNAPDSLTISAIEAVKGELPIIHDSHEALSLRQTSYYVSDDERRVLKEYPVEERTANEKSDGRVYVTEGVRDYIQERYDVDKAKDMVFYSYASEDLVPQRLKKKLSEKDGCPHIVYIGTVTSRIEGSHYDLREIFKGIAERGIHLHMYVSIWGTRDKAYQKLAKENRFIHYHGHLDQKTLLEEITRYDYGWAGFNVNGKNVKHLDVALPNKTFEYIVCGLPVLAFPHKTLRSFLERNKVGLAFKDLDEMLRKLETDEVARVKKNVLISRRRFTVESNINRVIQFYRAVLADAS
jgi:glycosyltransferase involved in cell wall biosynthesis